MHLKLTPAAFFHPHHYGYPIHHGAGMGHTITSMIFNAMIYSVIFRILRHIPLPVLILMVIVIGFWLWNNNRRSRW